VTPKREAASASRCSFFSFLGRVSSFTQEWSPPSFMGFLRQGLIFDCCSPYRLGRLLCSACATRYRPCFAASAHFLTRCRFSSFPFFFFLRSCFTHFFTLLGNPPFYPRFFHEKWQKFCPKPIPSPERGQIMATSCPQEVPARFFTLTASAPIEALTFFRS